MFSRKSLPQNTTGSGRYPYPNRLAAEPTRKERNDGTGRNRRRGSRAKRRLTRLASLREGHEPGEIRMTDYRVAAGESQEDQVTAAIEQYTSKAPSSAFLALAIGSIAA